jgi:NAD(P)-dependent dehydrogenase (short-subunit alcohol dehydrogenase family)
MAVWDRTYDVNVRGPMMTSKHAIPIMIRTAARGVILNVSSTSALRGDCQLRGVQLVEGRTPRVDAARLQSATPNAASACNTIATGFVMTEAARRNVGPTKLDILERSRLIDEPGTPQDIAAPGRFLASDEARYITGQDVSHRRRRHRQPAVVLGRRRRTPALIRRNRSFLGPRLALVNQPPSVSRSHHR